MVLLAYIDSGLHFPVAPVHFPLAVKSRALFTWNCQYAGVASRVQAVSVQHLKAAFGLGTDVIPHSEVDGLADHVRDFIGTEDPEIHVRMLATKICQAWLLNPNRNPGMSKAEMEEIFTRLLGVKKTVWLPGDPNYVTGDMTDGHVDGVCAFARPGVLLVDATHDKDSVYAEVVRENRRALELATDAQGRKFELIELFEATEALDSGAEVFCASYTNFYIANDAIIMPAYGIDADRVAAEVLGQAFPGREVVPVRINHLAHGGGGVHCITQQQPAWPLKG